MAALAPAIHRFLLEMDPRVKPGGDDLDHGEEHRTDPYVKSYADFLLFLSSSTSVNSASTTSSFAASLAASLSACCLYIASPSFIEACATALVLVLMASASSPFSASFKSLTASSMARRPLPSTFEPCSANAFSVECTKASAWFLASTASRRFLSSAALASASLTIF